MNNRITKLFSCCLENKVILIETNFKEFHSKFKSIEPSAHSDRWFTDKFKKEKDFEYVVDSKIYCFQRLV